MTDYTTERVNLVARDLLQKDENDMRQSSTVRAAQANLDNAQRWLQADPHNGELQAQVRQAQRDLYKAQDSFHRERRMAAIEQEKAAKAAIVAQAEAARASEIEAEAKAHMLDSWLRAGGTVENFTIEWERPGGLWAQELQRRAVAAGVQLRNSVEFRTEPTAHATAQPVPVPAAPEMVMVEAAPNLTPPSRAK